MDLTAQLRQLKAEGAVRAEFHPDGGLKFVEFDSYAPGSPRDIRPPSPPPKDDLRDVVLGNAIPDIEFDPSELPKFDQSYAPGAVPERS